MHANVKQVARVQFVNMCKGAAPTLGMPEDDAISNLAGRSGIRCVPWTSAQKVAAITLHDRHIEVKLRCLKDRQGLSDRRPRSGLVYRRRALLLSSVVPDMGDRALHQYPTQAKDDERGDTHHRHLANAYDPSVSGASVDGSRGDSLGTPDFVDDGQGRNQAPMAPRERQKRRKARPPMNIPTSWLYPWSPDQGRGRGRFSSVIGPLPPAPDEPGGELEFA